MTIRERIEAEKERLLKLPFTAERSIRVDQIDYLLGFE